MEKYIDADLLRKDIEFAKSVYDNPKRVVCGVADAFRQDGRAAMCDDILKKIDSLQQEQQMLKNAVEGEVVVPIYEGNDVWSTEIKIPGRYELGDKVRIIVLKAEED